MGDVINPVNLTPVALTEGIALVNMLYVNQPRLGNHDCIPTVFCQPPKGKVGLIEVRACVKYPDINIYKTSFTPLKNTLSGMDDKIFMKIIVVRRTNRVVGMHMDGTDAPEIIQVIAVALHVGATKAVFDSTIGIHPTAA